MLKQWASRLATVRRATTREELEAVYRFRYSVYFEEFGRELGSPDHDRRWVKDEDDENPCTTILYTGTPEHVTGTVRLRHWRAGKVPQHDVDELSMDRIPGIESYNTAEIGRLMVRRSMRGKLIIASLLRRSYQILAGEEKTDLTFCYCSPGLVRYYQQLAMRPFGGRPVAAPDGIMIPLVAVMSDHTYYREARSLLAPLVRRYFGPRKRPPLDLEPFRPLFAPGKTGIEFDPERVWATVEEVLATRGGECPFLQILPPETLKPLIHQGLVIDVPSGTLVTRKGFYEREIFVILEGTYTFEDHTFEDHASEDHTFEDHTFEDHPSPPPPLGCGQLFGEDAFLHPEGRRTASVRAQTPGRLLMLRGRTLEKMIRQQPQLAQPLERRLAAMRSGGSMERRIAA